MLLAIACLFATAAAAPASTQYDQRQDGDFNLLADVQNVMVLVAVPNKIPLDLLFSLMSKSNADGDQTMQDRSDVNAMEAFVEPSTPYRVEIGAAERSATDGRAAEVVIAGRHRLEADSQEQDEFKLLGATENCGPDRVRDPETLTCKAMPVKTSEEIEAPSNKKPEKVETQPTPEVVPS